MRILLCLNRDLESCVALNLLAPALAQHDWAFALTERVGAPDANAPPEREELRIAEQELPIEHWFTALERADVPPDGRFLTFAEWQRQGIAQIPLAAPNSPEGLALLRQFAPDVIVCIRYGAILQPSAIACARYGVLNLHSGLLPAYRGVLATFRALMNGDAEIACTVHQIVDAGIDTGPIVGVARVGVQPQRSLLWHVLALYAPGTRMLAGALATLAAGEALAVQPQPPSGTYFSYPTRAEWQAFSARGWRVAHMRDLAECFARFRPAAS